MYIVIDESTVCIQVHTSTNLLPYIIKLEIENTFSFKIRFGIIKYFSGRSEKFQNVNLSVLLQKFLYSLIHL